MNIKSLIRTIPAWPHPPVRFRDVSSLLRDPEGFGAAMDAFVGFYRDKPIAILAGLAAPKGANVLLMAYLIGTGGPLCAAVRLFGNIGCPINDVGASVNRSELEGL